jgi:hypothetical protein
MNCPAEETDQEDTDSPQRPDDFVRSSDAGLAGTSGDCSTVNEGNRDTPLPVIGGPQSINSRH